MKKCKFGIVLLLTLFLILVFFARLNNSENAKGQEAEEINITVEKPSSSAFWQLPFIHINNNWTQTGLKEWCSGSGKASDPYVIENVTTTYIKIENTDEYFILDNCSVSQSDLNPGHTGIELNNVKNGTINNCTIYENCIGIELENCKNITISNCHFFVNNFYGIYLIFSFNNTVKYNFEYYSAFGILLVYSNFNNISYNHIRINYYGIMLYRSNYTYVGHNTLEENDIGIINDECKGNIFEDNYDDSIPPPPPPLPPSVHHGHDDTDDLISNPIEFLIDPITLVFVYPILSALAIITTKELKKFLSSR